VSEQELVTSFITPAQVSHPNDAGLLEFIRHQDEATHELRVLLDEHQTRLYRVRRVEVEEEDAQ
jgi:hypothetical protein